MRRGQVGLERDHRAHRRERALDIAQALQHDRELDLELRQGRGELHAQSGEPRARGLEPPEGLLGAGMQEFDFVVGSEPREPLDGALALAIEDLQLRQQAHQGVVGPARRRVGLEEGARGAALPRRNQLLRLREGFGRGGHSWFGAGESGPPK